MAMIQCPECNQPLSDQAYACPHCGYPVKKAPPPSPFRISLRYNVKASCPAATFIRTMSILMMIGGLILAIAGSYQQEITGYSSYSGRAYYDTVFNVENFFTVLLTYLVYGVFGLILSKVVREVDAIHTMLTSLRMVTSSGDEKNSAPAAQKKGPGWKCAHCGFENRASQVWCRRCGIHKIEAEEFRRTPVSLEKADPAAVADASCGQQEITPSRRRVAQENHEPVPQDWKCPFCGNENPASEKYCRGCGQAR